MIRRLAFCIALLPFASQAIAETENPEICAALAAKPGIYLVRSTRDIEGLPTRQQQKLQRDIRVYVIPPPSRGQGEQVVHLRVTSKASRIEDNNASSVRLRRNAVDSSCRQSLFRKSKRAFDNDDDKNDASAADYNDFADNVSRSSKSLNEWHFRWDAGVRSRNCQYTADHVDPIKGFGRRKSGKALVSVASIDEARADERPPEIASLTSVLVHQANRSGSCFAFRLFQIRDARWTPVETRIEAWTFGEKRSDASKREFTVRWIP